MLAQGVGHKYYSINHTQISICHLHAHVEIIAMLMLQGRKRGRDSFLLGQGTC